MSGLSKGLRKVEVSLKWDPAPMGAPPSDLDIVAGIYRAADPDGEPAYLVHFDRRSPDGTITLNRDSRTGQGLGVDEAMTLELDRLSTAYSRVVVGVVIQQPGVRKTFGDIARSSYRVAEGYTELGQRDFSSVSSATAATVAEFLRDEHGAWEYHGTLRGFDGDPESFSRAMGAPPS